MKAKETRVIASKNTMLYEREAADSINKAVMESIGATAFNADDEYVIVKRFEEEIAECDPDIAKSLKIVIEEVELEDEE